MSSLQNFAAIWPSRSRGTAFLLALCLSGPALAQQKPLEETLPDRQADQAAVQDKAFDCDAFKKAISAASDGFRPLRASTRSSNATVAVYEVNAPLFGVCEIFEKKVIGEIGYSCEAEKLSLADIKATVEACLGDRAFGLASNENPNTPYLRYNPDLGGARARVAAFNNFGAKTLVILAPK